MPANVVGTKPDGAANSVIGQVALAHPDFDRALGDLKAPRDVGLGFVFFDFRTASAFRCCRCVKFGILHTSKKPQKCFKIGFMSDLTPSHSPDDDGLVGFEAEREALRKFERRKGIEPTPRTPEGSLREFARLLEKSTKQIRRYCQCGLIPGAYQTPKGHWRVPYDPQSVEQAQERIAEFERKRDVFATSKELQEVCPDAEFDYDDLAIDRQLVGKLLKEMEELAPKQGRWKYELLAAANSLTWRELKLTKTSIAAQIGISRATLYRRYPVRAMDEVIRAFVDRNSLLARHLGGLTENPTECHDANSEDDTSLQSDEQESVD